MQYSYCIMSAEIRDSETHWLLCVHYYPILLNIEFLQIVI